MRQVACPRRLTATRPGANLQPAALAFAYLRAETVELARHPGFVVPTLGFPALFFLLFGRSVAPGQAAAAWRISSPVQTICSMPHAWAKAPISA